jgi:hypothetical protein
MAGDVPSTTGCSGRRSRAAAEPERWANREWAREAWNDMKSFSTGGTYINFLTEDEGPERTNAALRKGVHRLAEVEARRDPQNVFRTNRNIKPV